MKSHPQIAQIFADSRALRSLSVLMASMKSARPHAMRETVAFVRHVCLFNKIFHEIDHFPLSFPTENSNSLRLFEETFASGNASERCEEL